jgi:hypothetical protein
MFVVELLTQLFFNNLLFDEMLLHSQFVCGLPHQVVDAQIFTLSV